MVAASGQAGEATLEDLAAGKVDRVAPTGCQDVTFRDLGLLVVDEEQRFGVATRSASSRCASGWTS